MVYYYFKNSRQELREASFPIRCVWVPPWQGGWEGEARPMEVRAAQCLSLPLPSGRRGRGPSRPTVLTPVGTSLQPLRWGQGRWVWLNE